MFELGFNSQKEMSIFSSRGLSKNKGLTLKTVADQWLGSVEPFVKLSTLHKYRRIIENHILPVFAQTKLTAVTRLEWLTFGQTCLNNKLSEKTTNDIIRVLNSLLAYATNEYNMVFPKIPTIQQVCYWN